MFVTINGRVEAILCLPESSIIAIPEILTSIEVVDAFTFSLLAIDVDVLLLDGWVEERRGRFVLLPTGHVVSFEDASSLRAVVAVGGSGPPSGLPLLSHPAIIHLLHAEQLPSKAAILRNGPHVVWCLMIEAAILLEWV